MTAQIDRLLDQLARAKACGDKAAIAILEGRIAALRKRPA
jgi:hypothetical protein